MDEVVCVLMGGKSIDIIGTVNYMDSLGMFKLITKVTFTLHNAAVYTPFAHLKKNVTTK